MKINKEISNLANAKIHRYKTFKDFNKKAPDPKNPTQIVVRCSCSAKINI